MTEEHDPVSSESEIEKDEPVPAAEPEVELVENRKFNYVPPKGL